jgi:hypothetical protein
MWSQVGPQAIQVSEVNSYTKDTLGVTDLEERMKYLRFINKMDTVELKYLNERRKAATP